MTTIRLYWNNICVLHRQELQFLNEIREELRKDNIDLDITCFGLGYGRHMSDYLREEDSVLPDLVVSTDLEVFEDERIWNRFREHGLLPLKEFFPVKDIPELGGLKKASALLPYLAIPLVFYSDVELLRQTSMDARSINANFFTGTDADSEQSISLNRLVESSFWPIPIRLNTSFSFSAVVGNVTHSPTCSPSLYFPRFVIKAAMK